MNVGRKYFGSVLQRSNLRNEWREDKLSESSGFGGTMCAGMSISVVGAHLSTDATFTCQRGLTAVREISLQVLWRSNRVQHLEVIFGHVQVTEGEVLESCSATGKHDS
jgi:hypothetical protein